MRRKDVGKETHSFSFSLPSFFILISALRAQIAESNLQPKQGTCPCFSFSERSSTFHVQLLHSFSLSFLLLYRRCVRGNVLHSLAGRWRSQKNGPCKSNSALHFVSQSLEVYSHPSCVTSPRTTRGLSRYEAEMTVRMTGSRGYAVRMCARVRVDPL